MKQIFTIPDNCKTVTVEQFGDKIIATFEAIYEPKDGDIFTSKEHPTECIAIYRECGTLPKMSYYACLSYGSINVTKSECSSSHLGYQDNTRLATESEKQQLFAALEKEGRTWNAEKKVVEKLRWRAESRGRYFAVTLSDSIRAFPSSEVPSFQCSEHFKEGNYFQTESEAELFAEKVRELFKSRTL